jgi:DNA invertase Pin-like site-specific DNA recombinase
MAMRRAAIYLRVSLDPTGEMLTVTRNEEDCQKLAQQRGWQIVETFTDNSISAKGDKHRPAFAAMLQAVEGGQIDTVVAWSLDRLTRNARDRLALVEACRKHGTIISVVKGSDMDPTTAAGRLVIGVLGEAAQMEIDMKSERQTAAARQRSKLGRPPVGTRLTGYTPKGETVPDEAAIVRRIYEMFYAGESLYGICQTFNAEGVPTRRNSRPWNPATARGILINPRYAGRAIYQGEVTGGRGNWEPLVSEEVFDVIQARLNDPRRLTRRLGMDRKYLGSGLYLCAECKEPVRSGSKARYLCRLGHFARVSHRVDELVQAVVAERIRTAAAEIGTRMNTSTAPDWTDELKKLRDRRAATEADYDNDLIDGRRFKAKMERIAAEMEQLQARTARASNNAALAEVMASDDPPQAFLDASLMIRRAVVDALVVVQVHRAPRGRKEFDQSSVEVTPK